jgi:hypothetical protein
MGNFIDFLFSIIKSNFTYDWASPDPLDEESFLSMFTNLKSLNPEVSITATWEEYSTFKQNNINVRALRQLKGQRDSLLQQSDWVLTYDNVQTLANLDEWVAYRQDLRDFFSKASFELKFVGETVIPDLAAMNFPPAKPGVIRK